MLPKGLPEAIPTAVCNWIPVEDVHGFAVLFDIDDINNLEFNPAGLDNAYFTRRYLTPSGRYSTQKEFISFPNPKSFSKRMVDFEVVALKESTGNMSIRDEWAGRRKVTKLKGHNVAELRDYLHGRVVRVMKKLLS